MQTDSLQKEAAAPVDEATKAVIEEAQAAARRGETVSSEQAKINARERYKAWRKTQKTNAIPA